MEAGTRHWARAIASCPHCGRTALFDANGVCPSCHVAGDAPVTDADHARIAEIARTDATRPAARPDVQEGGLMNGLVAGALIGIPALLYAVVARPAPGFRKGVSIGLVLHASCLGLGALVGD